MEANLSVGDVVTLKSGGPQMTVEELEDSSVSCVWFEGRDVRRATFPIATVQKYVPPRIRR